MGEDIISTRTTTQSQSETQISEPAVGKEEGKEIFPGAVVTSAKVQSNGASAISEA